MIHRERGVLRLDRGQETPGQKTLWLAPVRATLRLELEQEAQWPARVQEMLRLESGQGALRPELEQETLRLALWQENQRPAQPQMLTDIAQFTGRL